MGEVILLLGPTGSGKTTQADRLATRLGGVRLSSGDLVRASSDPVMRQILAEGGLAPSELITPLVFDAMDRVDQSKAIVLDGYPRMLNESKELEAMLPKLKRQIRRVVFLEVPEPETTGRLAKRGRVFDDAANVKRRWELYMQETLPVVAHYEQQGLLVKIDAVGPIEAISQRVAEAL